MGREGHRRQGLIARLFSGTMLAGLMAVLVLLGAPEARAGDWTAVQPVDPGGNVPNAIVSVANAKNGRVVATGLTDSGTGLFTFAGNASKQYVVTVYTSTGYVGAAIIGGGGTATVTASIPVGDLAQTAGTHSAGAGSASGPADARVSVIATKTFEPVARGTTDSSGWFEFNVPSDLQSGNLLATFWKDGVVTLQLLQASPQTEFGGGDWPAF